MIDKFPHMQTALDAAREAEKMGEVPVGAVIVSPSGEVLSVAHNLVLHEKDPSAHAEIVAIREAARLLESERLTDCDLYVTLEPCPMCAGAITHARIRRVYFGAEDEKGGGVVNGPKLFDQSTAHHRPEVYGNINENESAKILRDFFTKRR